MKHIENIYQSYDDILQEFTEDVIKSRYENLYKELSDFLDGYSLREELRIDEVALTHAVFDYYSDISRLKKFHKIKNVNDIKVYAYESYWLLRRHPIQIRNNKNTEERIVFANEKFVFSRIAQFLMDGIDVSRDIMPESRKSVLNYFDTIYYYLKYRDCSAQVLEMLILSFYAGKLIGEDCAKTK